MTASKTKTNSSRPSFPQRVYNVLKLSEDQHQEHIISWMNNGTAFKVHDLDEFERDMLPKYFKTQKYATFTRALCAYGFTCVRTGRQTGICKLFPGEYQESYRACSTPITSSPLHSRFLQTHTLSSLAANPQRICLESSA